MRFVLLFISLVSCVPKSTMQAILDSGSESSQAALNNPAHEVQIVYGEISGDSIIHHYYNHDPDQFFYPASSVKMLAAFAAVQRLSESELPLQTQIRIDSQQFQPVTLAYDSLFQAPYSIENLLEKIFVYSDNQAYNMLYNWLGKGYINQVHSDIGLQTRVVHKLAESAFSFPQVSNDYTLATQLTSADDRLLTKAQKQQWGSNLKPKEALKGVGFIDSLGTLINDPFDFSRKNFVPLSSLLGSLERVVKPELFPAAERYGFDSSTHTQVMKILALRPEDLPHPVDTLPDNYVKFLMVGDQEDGVIPDHIQIFNKVGWAYGYLTDVAYIRDDQKDIEFFLAATIHVNANQIYNDGKYEYEEVGLPFLGELGRLFYLYELAK